MQHLHKRVIASRIGCLAVQQALLFDVSARTCSAWQLAFFSTSRVQQHESIAAITGFTAIATEQTAAMREGRQPMLISLRATTTWNPGYPIHTSTKQESRGPSRFGYWKYAFPGMSVGYHRGFVNYRSATAHSVRCRNLRRFRSMLYGTGPVASDGGR